MTSLKPALIIAALMGFCLPFIIGPIYLRQYRSVRPAARVKAVDREVTPTPVPPTSTPTPSPTAAPTLKPTPTVIKSDTTTYKDPKYNFKISFPSSWQGILNTKTNLGLQTYTVSSPNKSESIEILISDGIWDNVKLEIGPWSKKSTFLGRPCLIRKTGKTTAYVFPSKSGNIIFRLSVTGNSPQLTKVFKSFLLQ